MNTRFRQKAIQIRKVVFGWAVRLASIYVGARIVYHEVWQADTAEPIVLGLGLWLIGVPPAMWMDGVRRLGRFAEVVEQAGAVMQEAQQLSHDDKVEQHDERLERQVAGEHENTTDDPDQESQCEPSTGT